MNAPFGSVPPEPESEPKRETQVIAIYGKGGIGKSFTLANLSYLMAQPAVQNRVPDYQPPAPVARH